MKRVVLSLMLILGLSMSLSAKKEAMYAYDTSLADFCGMYWIDREAQLFYFDSDSEDDATMMMKNYKKNGNKETFDIYQKSNPSKKVGSVVLVINPELTAKDDLTSQSLVVKAFGQTYNHGVKTEKQNGNKSTGGDINDVVDKAKEGAKNLFNKGKNLFKKKDKKEAE